MTIKQQGGIFGRNPTFNDVEVEGNLTVGGSAISSVGTMASQNANNVNIDGGAIDGTTLGESSRSTGKFTTANTSSYLTVESSGGSGLRMYGSSGTNQWDVYLNSTNLRFSDNTGGGVVQFDTNVNLNNSNLVIGTSGKGIDFSATSDGGTVESELLNDYEDGYYTATLTPATSGTITLNTGYNKLAYTKVGRLVTVGGHLYVSSSSSPVGSTVDVNLPFTVAAPGTGAINRAAAWSGIAVTSDGAASVLHLTGASATTITLQVDASTIGGTYNFRFGFSYIAA